MPFVPVLNSEYDQMACVIDWLNDIMQQLFAKLHKQ